MHKYFIRTPNKDGAAESKKHVSAKCHYKITPQEQSDETTKFVYGKDSDDSSIQDLKTSKLRPGFKAHMDEITEENWGALCNVTWHENLGENLPSIEFPKDISPYAKAVLLAALVLHT